MFLDSVKIEVNAGKGGNGIVAYRRELKVEMGGPFGGSGGKGGDIVFRGNSGLSTLLDLKFMKVIKGNNGENGRNKGMYGAQAENTVIDVPLGTTVYDEDTNEVVADITKPGQMAVIAKGGRGGRGNMAFATGINKCPDFSEQGEPGEKRYIRCELKVLADCGLVGFPSVGKSTLINACSAAKAKVAAYHFTTIVPNLGMVRLNDERSFVMADLPGIIEGASQGLGLGLEFLKHIERCRVIVHVIDMAGTEGRDPLDDFEKINAELKSYKMNLMKRPMIVAANKMDVDGALENLNRFKEKYPDIEVFAISAYTHQNLEPLLYKVADTLEVTEEFSLLEDDERQDIVNYTFREEEKMFEISKDDAGRYIVTGKPLERIVAMINFNQESAVIRFTRQLRSFGVDEALRKAGCKDGDIVRVLDMEFEFRD